MSNTRSAVPVLAYTPLKLLLAYLIGTLLIALFGPTIYFGFPTFDVVLFMSITMVVMTFGYINGVRVPIKTAKSGTKMDRKFVIYLFRTSLIAALLTLTVSVGASIWAGTFNIDVDAIGTTYMDGYEGYERNSGSYSLVFLIYSFSLPFTFIAMIWGMYYFRSLTKLEKAAVIFLLFGSLIFYVLGSGKQKQLGDTLIYFIAIFGIHLGVRNKVIATRTIVLSVLGSVISLFSFMFILSQRYAAIAFDAFNYNQKSLNSISMNVDHPIFTIFGPDMGLSMAIFLGYLSQGYYGLGLAMTVEHSWTYFLGFSYSLSVIANRLLGMDWVWNDSLVHQTGLQHGWGESKWHTVFTHFATDFTFPGTIIIFGFIAYLYARVWMSAIRYQNPFAILMFAMLTLGAFFIPANNQLLHAPGNLFTVIVITILYLAKARSFNRKSN